MSDTAERTRINVRDPRDNSLEGWFVLESATRYREQCDSADGFSRISVNTGSEHAHQTLYRTKGGQWVLNHWSDYQNDAATYEFIGDDAAKTWLMLNDEDAAAEEHFGPVEEEAGPNLGGRPEIGPRVPGFTMPKATLERVDGYAKAEGISRNEALRRLIERGLEFLPVS